MTNGDVVRNMNDEELSTYLYNHDFCKNPVQTNKENLCNLDCKTCIEKFIKGVYIGVSF